MENPLKKNAQDTYLTLKEALKNEEFMKCMNKIIIAQKQYLKHKYDNGENL